MGPAAQAAVIEALFRVHFADGRDISDEEWLVRVARDAAGLLAAAVRADLRDDDCRRLVDDEVVPCVVVAGCFKVGGYQDETIFEAVFDRVRAVSMA